MNANELQKGGVKTKTRNKEYIKKGSKTKKTCNTKLSLHILPLVIFRINLC